MRKWIIAGGFLLVLVVVTIFALVNLNSLVNRNKDYLVAQAEAVLGRRVEVGDIGLTLWGGIGARFKQFSLADDPSFSNEPFIRAADLQINMKLLPLLRKEFQVSKVILHQPAINIVKDQNGQYNFSTIGRDKQRKERPKDPGKEKKERAEEHAAPPPLFVSLVDVDDGAIRYIDKKEGIDFRVSQLDFRVKDINLDRPVDISLEAAVLGASKQNLRVKARAGPIGPKADLSNLPIEGDFELEPVPLANLNKGIPGFRETVPPGLDLAGAMGAEARFSGVLGKHTPPQVNGTVNLSNVSARITQLSHSITNVNAKINFTGKSAELPETSFRIGKAQIRLAAKAASFTPLNLSYRLSAPELNLADLRAPSPGRQKPEIIKDLKSEGSVSIQNGVLTHRGTLNSPAGTIADADYTNLQTSTSFANRVLTIESLSLGAFRGTLSARGRYDMRESVPSFAATGNVKEMDLTQISRSLFPTAPQNIQGLLNLDLDVIGAGKEWETIQKALKGHGRTEVINGVLLNVNLADSVLSNTGIPGFASIVPSDLKKKYPAVFSSKDTEFKQLKGSAIIKDGKAYTDDLIVAAAEFESLGKGWYSFDRSVDLRGVLLLSQMFSQDIISRARETKGLANDQGRIEVPFTMSGRLPGAKPKPDLGYVARALQKGAFERGLDSFFRRRSPRGESETAPWQQEPSSGSQERKKRSRADEIRRGLEGLFGR